VIYSRHCEWFIPVTVSIYLFFFVFFLSPLSLLSLLNHVCNNFTLKESICLSFVYCARNQKDSKWNRSLIVCAKRNYKRRGRYRGTNSQWLGKREKIILHSQGWSYLIFGLTKWIHSLPLNYIKLNLIVLKIIQTTKKNSLIHKKLRQHLLKIIWNNNILNLFRLAMFNLSNLRFRLWDHDNLI
jgi:hypothetical protein